MAMEKQNHENTKQLLHSHDPRSGRPCAGAEYVHSSGSCPKARSWADGVAIHIVGVALMPQGAQLGRQPFGALAFQLGAFAASGNEYALSVAPA